jgi:hypothetical protein
MWVNGIFKEKFGWKDFITIFATALQQRIP